MNLMLTVLVGELFPYLIEIFSILSNFLATLAILLFLATTASLITSTHVLRLIVSLYQSNQRCYSLIIWHLDKSDTSALSNITLGLSKYIQQIFLLSNLNLYLGL